MKPLSEEEVRHALRDWVRRRSAVEVPETFDDHTPLITNRYLTSLQVADLLLYVEELRGESLDPASLRPGVFRDIDTIYTTFIGGGA
ncbi:MAG: hypothetical protein KY450_10200 [Actinobacteria bacterium]|nr:hypothetical protein [Actinomycetota bacterium]